MANHPFHTLLARAGEDLRNGRYDAAERIYRDILAQAPGDAAAMHYLGVTLVQSGRTDEGLDVLADSMKTLQGESSYRHNYGLMLAQAGRLAEAERELEATVALAPSAPLSHHYLGIVRQRLGHLEDASRAYRAALELSPGDPSVAADYGFCLLENGDASQAVDWLQRAAAGAPQNAVAHNNLGCALRATGALTESIASARRALAVDPQYAAAWYNLGLALRDAGDSSGAFDALCHAVREGPDFAPAWQAFADEFVCAHFTGWDKGAARELTQALSHPAIDPGPLAGAAASLLMLDPEFGPVFRELENQDSRDGAWFDEQGLGRLAHPMLIALIEHAVVPDPGFEGLLVALRSRAMSAWSRGELKSSPLLVDLLGALAQQCFLNEYVWPEAAEESSRVQSLAAGLGPTSDLAEVLLLGAYRPLAALAGRLPPPPASGVAARVWQRQIDEPAVERRLRDGVASLTTVEDATSRAVQHQYEENPYPRWHRLFATPYPLRRALRSLFPEMDLSRLHVPDAPDILIAGCGTGYHAAITAARNPGARITAVDLSRTSLAYAMRRCGELGLTNVRFAQADILQLPGWRERFDCVECTGVLHHLRDPSAGWAVLSSLVKPGGVMRIALYSEIARRGLAAARDLVARQGLRPSLDGIRAARALVLAQPLASPARQLVDSPDFYTASGARDLMMHVQEHCFDTARIAEALDALGLEFLGFELTDPGVAAGYRHRFPEDPTATSLARWGRFEIEHPTTFAGMYQFWVAKHGGSQ